VTTVRLYGLTRGYGSYAQVLRGFEQAFVRHGYGPDRLAVVEVADRAEEEPALPTADAGIFLGPPIACSALFQHAEHRIRCVMVAPNSDRLPEPTMKVVSHNATDLLVPSAWAATVAARYTDKPVLVVPHGVHDGFQPSASPSLERAYEGGEFRLLHLSSSTRERKGTLVLIKAWRKLRRLHALPEESRLWLVVAAETRGQILDWCVDEGETLEKLGILVGPRLGSEQEGARPADLAKVYAGVHAVCQPSRGEAFGLCPLEALACGVPIIATRATGHSQWFSEPLDGAVPVLSGEPDSIDDLVGAHAPRVSVSHIAKAIEWTYENWHKLKAAALTNAQNIRLTWSWERQTAEFIRWLETHK
jgi:glycosyltransferase involved in cell wall biosynthesis